VASTVRAVRLRGRPEVTEAGATQPGIGIGSARDHARSFARLLRRHLAFVILLAIGTVLRLIALVAIYPGIWFSDSNSYIASATTGTLSPIRVQGYALFLAPFLHVGGAPVLIPLQHLLGLGTVVVLYALLVRRGINQLIAALAVAPAALDLYVVDIEHMIMSETLFHLALAGAFAFLLWQDRPGIKAMGACGLLLGYAAIVRSVALPFFLLVILYMLVRRFGLYRSAAFLAAWAVVICTYLAVYDIQYGRVAFTSYGGRFLYAKVAPYADCSRLSDVPSDERDLCPIGRRLSSNSYLWTKDSPLYGLPLSADSRIGDFARRVVRDDPIRYAKIVVRQTLHYFEPGHRRSRNDYFLSVWQFPRDPRVWGYPGYRGPIRTGTPTSPRFIDPNAVVTSSFAGSPSVHVLPSRFLHGLQRFVDTPGPLLAALLVLVLVGLAWRPRRHWRLRVDAGLLAACVLSALVFTSMLSIFDYRYGLIAVIFLPPAGAMAGTALARAWLGKEPRSGPANAHG
jgi:hypothetical protein